MTTPLLIIDDDRELAAMLVEYLTPLGASWRPPFKSESSTFPSSLHSHHEHDSFLHVSEEVTDKGFIPGEIDD